MFVFNSLILSNTIKKTNYNYQTARIMSRQSLIIIVFLLLRLINSQNSISNSDVEFKDQSTVNSDDKIHQFSPKENIFLNSVQLKIHNGQYVFIIVVIYKLKKRMFYLIFYLFYFYREILENMSN